MLGRVESSRSRTWYILMHMVSRAYPWISFLRIPAPPPSLPLRLQKSPRWDCKPRSTPYLGTFEKAHERRRVSPKAS